MSYPKRLLSVGSKLRTYKLRTAPVFLTLDPCQFFGGFTKLGAVCHSHEPGTRSFTGIAACVRVEVIYCDRRDGLIVVVIACDFLAADVSTSIFLKDSATTSTSMFANMKLLSLATAIRSTCAVRREPCSMSFDMYTVHKCSRAPDSSLSAVVGVACQSLDGSFDLDTLNGWAEEGCQIIFHTDTDCCDVGCQALGTCCSSNDESTQWPPYAVLRKQTWDSRYDLLMGYILVLTVHSPVASAGVVAQANNVNKVAPRSGMVSVVLY